MTAADTAGLRAVARVRSMREQDSLFGLQHALGAERADRQRLEALTDRLARTTSPEDGAVTAFLEVRASMLSLGHAIATAQEALASSETMAVAALTRWQHDKTQLDAIELLQERRADEARAELLRLEARDTDEAAGQLWRRTTAGAR